jgi:soluble cytochrome b562
MSISAISGAASNPLQSLNSQQNFRQTFSQLVDALDSGDLSQAQQAYSDLSQLQADGQGPATNPNSPLAGALNNIGQALQNGDLGGAQQALASMQQAQRGHHHGHHGHGSQPASTPSSSSSSPPADTQSSSNLVDITA